MEKSPNIIIEETRNKIIDDVTESKLPAMVVQMILREVLQGVDMQTQQIIQQEKEQYQKSLQEEKEKNNKEKEGK